ncbi:hypothetical protein V1294_006033 [Bradyrhizobium sp. AZCC 1678]|uniref:hypothetical protein n=1 Tax=Bradyrhizobium sp. AZCC 1678 TaxID=3117030 RepID=UPI002FF25E76
MDRRELIAGAAATAVVATMPAVAVVAVDLEAERMKRLFHQLLDLLRSEGYAIARLNDGGKILFWLDNRQDITSMCMMSLDEDASPDVVEVLERAAATEPTAVRL